MPLRAIYRHAIGRDEVTVNPTTNLELPGETGQRDRVATAGEAALLLAALPDADRAIWATAFYGGLRLGELRGLRWGDVDLAKGEIRVERGWDVKEGEIAPKSKKSRRAVPIAAVLRDYLTAQKARTEGGAPHFVFPGRTNDVPFTPSYIRKRAVKAWETANVKRVETNLAPLKPIGLHEARHTYVSLMVDAGLSLERVGDYVGHSTTYMTDRYRHLLDGHGDETRRIMDEYLARADTAGRLAQLDDDDRAARLAEAERLVAELRAAMEEHS
jgi:integrase